jgi:hypothetical protein
MNYHNDTKRVRAGLRQAFKTLRKRGYTAKANFWCCQSCGVRAMPDEVPYVFYHAQDNDRLNERGICHLNWAGNGLEIKLACEAAGLKVDWNGSDDMRIQVSAYPEAYLKSRRRLMAAAKKTGLVAMAHAAAKKIGLMAAAKKIEIPVSAHRKLVTINLIDIAIHDALANDL